MLSSSYNIEGERRKERERERKRERERCVYTHVRLPGFLYIADAYPHISYTNCTEIYASCKPSTLKILRDGEVPGACVCEIRASRTKTFTCAFSRDSPRQPTSTEAWTALQALPRLVHSER